MPCVVDDASELAVVMLLVVGDPDTLGKESGVVVKVEGAGEETSLRQDVCDVSNWAGMSGIDVGNLTVGGGCTGYWRGCWCGCFVAKVG